MHDRVTALHLKFVLRLGVIASTPRAARGCRSRIGRWRSRWWCPATLPGRPAPGRVGCEVVWNFVVARLRASLEVLVSLAERLVCPISSTRALFAPCRLARRCLPFPRSRCCRDTGRERDLKDSFGDVEGLGHQTASISPCQGVEQGTCVCPCFASG
jgi:hypothetical protein